MIKKWTWLTIILLVATLFMQAGCQAQETATEPAAAPTAAELPATTAPTLPALTATAVLIDAPVSAEAPLEDTAVYDFEDGTSQGWIPRGGTSVSVATEVAYSGSNSLLTSNRTENWHGVTVNMLGLLQAGETYEISAYVKLAEGEPASRVILTMQRTPKGGDPAYEWISPSSADGVTDAEWVYLKGQYSFEGEVSDLMLYIESSDEELVGFYVDDISITLIPTAKGSKLYDFEDGSLQGWGSRGEAAVAVASDMNHSGSYSLLTTNRSANWHGASVNIMGLLEPDVSYEISAYVKLAEGEPNSRVILTVQRTPAGGSTVYEQVAPSSVDGVTDSKWVYLQGKYSYSGEVTELLLYVESPDEEYVDFYIDDIAIMGASAPAVQTDIPSLYQTLSEYFLVGAALESDQITSNNHASLLLMHFNSITAGNAMKPGPIQPVEGEFRWDAPDRMVEFARENDLAVHGHTLVWHSQAAEWMFKDSNGKPLEATPENKALVLQRLETHIREVVGRYKDDVNVWDVVNEVVDPDEPDCMLRSRWYELTGMDYIITAFEVANEIAPDADLIINDYSTTEPKRRACIYNLVRDLRAQGVPVDGVGHQMHINIEYPSAAAIEETILMFAELDVTQHITELDMSIYTNDTDSYTSVPEEVMVAQGYRYKEVFDVLIRQAQYIDSVTLWGLADDETWLKTWPTTRLNLPLLFDERLRAKYAYWGVVDPTQLPVFIQQTSVPQATPIIDSEPELQWNIQSWIELGTVGDATARFQTRWDENNLYVFVDVKDAVQNLDKIEIFIDENNGKTESYENDDRHFTFQDGECAACEGGITYSTAFKTDGYRLEAAFPLSAKASAGGQIGFDLRFTDGEQPDAPISWNDRSHSQDNDTSKFGTLIFTPAAQVTAARPGTPVIDAEEDAVWANADEIATDIWVVGSSGATAKVKTLWDSQHLYVYATVTDSLLSKASGNTWEQDSIEVFIDQNNAKTSTYQPDDGQFRVNYDNEQSYNGAAASVETITSATRIIPGGYVIELAITLTGVTPQDGVVIGFDFQVNNDEDGNGVRDSVAIWNDPTGQSYQNTSRIGLLQFVK